MEAATRFAPSPTGLLHRGHAYSALLAFERARALGARFHLRIEDIDQTRCRPAFTQAVLEDLAWLGLHWDRVERQSLRFDRYRAAAEELKAKDRFYECFETPVELDLKRKKQLNMGKPPVYDRTSLHQTAAEKAALRAEGITVLDPELRLFAHGGGSAHCMTMPLRRDDD